MVGHRTVGLQASRAMVVCVFKALNRCSVSYLFHCDLLSYLVSGQVFLLAEPVVER